MTKTESGRTTASPMVIVQEISELSENSDLQLASVAALLDQFGSTQKEKLSKLKASAESAQREFSDIQKALSESRATCLQAERDRDDTKLALAGSQSEYQASQLELQRAQKNYHSAQEELQRVRAELEQATGRVTAQQEDLRKLSTANKNIKRRIRHAAIAASVIVAVGLTTWLSGAHALFLAAH
jgi:chromosome segregation ATPase